MYTPLLPNDAFKEMKLCKITFIAFVSYPPFLAPSNAFPCIAITYSPFATGAARHVAILTVLPYNTSCKHIMIQLCAVYFFENQKYYYFNKTN